MVCCSHLLGAASKFRGSLYDASIANFSFLLVLVRWDNLDLCCDDLTGVFHERAVLNGHLRSYAARSSWINSLVKPHKN